uniref:Uncharacterized protein n=1 Tax=Rhizophora mucronata TaxID=61149 RepID=A0A2P2QA60_RHIMU
MCVGFILGREVVVVACQ